MWKWLIGNTEKWLFRFLGIALFGFAIYNLRRFQVTEFVGLFAVAFFCWFYANIARFKRFKGFGFEAELWEDKQREAEKLIDRLKVLVGLYSSELIMIKTQAGRWGDGRNRWTEVADLYKHIQREHAQLSADIDLSKTTAKLGAYFVFDAVMPRTRKLRELVEGGTSEAQKMIQREFGNPITDNEGYSRRLAQLREVRAVASSEEPIRMAERKVLATEVLEWFDDSKTKLKTYFNVSIEAPLKIKSDMLQLQALEQGGAFELSDDNLRLATDES